MQQWLLNLRCVLAVTTIPRTCDGEYGKHLVGDLSVHTLTPVKSKVILTATVRHSQAVTGTPLKPWVAAEKGGTIISAHCTCMAGLGEACSHIAALLFSTEAYTRHMKNISCTSNPCEWLPPTMKNVPYAPISDINFSAPSAKRKKILLNALPPKNLGYPGGKM